MRGLDPRIHRLGKSIAKIRKALATAGWTAADFMNVAAGLLARGDTRPRSKQLPLRCWPIFDVRQHGRDCFGRHVCELLRFHLVEAAAVVRARRDSR
jgi:hypothetical protein